MTLDEKKDLTCQEAYHEGLRLIVLSVFHLTDGSYSKSRKALTAYLVKDALELLKMNRTQLKELYDSVRSEVQKENSSGETV